MLLYCKRFLEETVRAVSEVLIADTLSSSIVDGIETLEGG